MKYRQYLAVFKSKHESRICHEHRFWCWDAQSIIERAWESAQPQISMANYELIRIELLPKSQWHL